MHSCQDTRGVTRPAAPIPRMLVIMMCFKAQVRYGSTAAPGCGAPWGEPVLGVGSQGAAASVRREHARAAAQLRPTAPGAADGDARARVAAECNATIAELRARVMAEQGARAGHPVMWTALARLGLTLDKTGHLSPIEGETGAMAESN